MICLAVWIGAVSVTRIVSVGSVSAALTLPVVAYLLPDREGTAMVWFAVALCAFVVWAHRSNIKRLLRGEESSFRRPAPERGSETNPETSPEFSPQQGEDSA